MKIFKVILTKTTVERAHHLLHAVDQAEADRQAAELNGENIDPNAWHLKDEQIAVTRVTPE